MKQWVLVLFRGKSAVSFRFHSLWVCFGLFCGGNLSSFAAFSSTETVCGCPSICTLFFFSLYSQREASLVEKVQEISATSCNFELLVVVFGS